MLVAHKPCPFQIIFNCQPQHSSTFFKKQTHFCFSKATSNCFSVSFYQKRQISKTSTKTKQTMSTVLIHSQPRFFAYSCYRMKNHHKLHKISSSWTMMKNESESLELRKKEELSIEYRPKTIPEFGELRPSNLRFDKLQPSEHELVRETRLEFGQFIAREALIDEEYWSAAWLRAETHWEDRPSERYVDNYKRKFADQEFNELKRRSKATQGQKSTCIVTVKKEEANTKRTVIKSLVGTLDLSIRYLLHGETFPGERVKAPLFCSINRTSETRYGYIANLCVSKFARRQGIATNMLRLAVLSALSNGSEQVYVHVDRKNRAAQELYQKVGFEMVQSATAQLSKESIFLLCYKA